MSTLYVSDLDGTLLRSNETVSEHTIRVISELTERGMIFSYATARSFITAKKVTKGLTAQIPLVVYNGAFVIDNVTERIMLENYYDSSVDGLLDELFRHDVYPIVYARIGGREKFSFVPGLCTKGMNEHIESRKGDIRTNPVGSPDELRNGRIFYISCIDTPEKLFPLYEQYRETYHCVYQADIYTGAQWLEIMPKETSKSNAVRRLKELLGCDRLVAFGDGRNDIDLFELADEGYAVENAHEDLKAYAAGIIPSNDEDGVAHWLERNFTG